VTVKVATPEALEVAEIGVIVSAAPRLELSEMVFPEMPCPTASFSVIVTVEEVLPSARIELGETLTVD
jgi:hypothetical protein